MSIQLHPPVPLVSLVKTEPLTVIKIEPSEEALEKEISPDIKDINIVYHSLSEDLIKSETVPENILETKYSESVETQVLVKAENSPFIKIENITQRNKTEDASNENVTRGTGQEVIEVQGSHEYSNTLSNLETHKQLVLYSSKDLNGIGTSIRKAKHPEKTYFSKCYKTVETTSWEKGKEKIKLIKVPVIPVEAHEYTSLAKDRLACNHCQYACNRLKNLKLHIKQMHRWEFTTMYRCPYCPFKSKWKWSIQCHIQKHVDTKDIQWFQCHLCESKFKLRCNLTRHMMIHLKHKQMQDGLDQKSFRFHCDKCSFKTDRRFSLKHHKLTHLKPEEIEYFYCYHCSHKSKLKMNLKSHIFRHFKNENIPFHCYICDFVTPKRDLIIEHVRKHFKNRNKYDETIRKYQAETRIKKLEKRYCCDKCNYKTDECSSWKRHHIIHLKPEEIQYFYCYHCSYKAKLKRYLRRHIFTHFKKHPKHHSKCDETKYKYQLETHTKKPAIRYYCEKCKRAISGSNSNFKLHVLSHKTKAEMDDQDLKYCCEKCDYKTYRLDSFKRHKITHLKPKEIQYFHCYHCSSKFKRKGSLKTHILRHFQREEIKFDCYICDFTTLKRALIVEHFKKHPKHHSEYDETKYKYQLETCTENPKTRYLCDNCNYKTDHHHCLKRHKLIHIKPEEIQYFYCYHCSYKAQQKCNLTRHIIGHFKNEKVPFHCYICDFVTLKRDAIIEHFKKHPKHHSK